MEREEGLPAAGDEEFTAVCTTCGETRKFDSELEVFKFKLSHVGHDVKTGAEAVSKQSAPAKKEAVAEETKQQAKQTGGRLEKLSVDVLAQPDGPTVFRLTGYAAEGKKAFVIARTLDKAEEVKRIVESWSMERVEPDGRKVVYSWEPSAVEISEEARRLMNAKKEPEPEKKEERQREEQAVKAKEEEMRQFAPKVIRQEVGVPSFLKPARLGQEQSKERSELRKREVQPQSSRRTVQESETHAPQVETAEEQPLLLAKSSYIQQSEETMKEAARVSNVLRSFRWRIEPTYTIGVLFDDNLSIVTNTGLMSKGLIEKIEEMGYELVAISAEGGKPTAWFKRNLERRKEGAGIGPVDVEVQPGQDFEIK